MSSICIVTIEDIPLSQLHLPSLHHSHSQIDLIALITDILFFFCFIIDVPNTQLSSSLSSTKSISHKKDLMDALRRTNPAGVNTAPVIFWDVEGALKTVSLKLLFPAFKKMGV